MSLIPFVSLFRKEVRRWCKVVLQTILAPLVNTGLYLMIFGINLGKFIDVGEGIPYLIYLIPGLMMMGVLNQSFANSSSSIVISKFHGDLEDLRIAPIRAHTMVWAMSMASAFRGLLVGLVTSLMGVLFILVQGVPWELTLPHPFLTLFFLSMGALSFGQLGMTIGFFARNFDQVGAVSTFILLPLTYLGGVFFSLQNLHPFWQKLSEMNPLLYYINGLRYAVIDHSDIAPATCIVVTLISLGLTTCCAYLSVKKGSFRRY
jgi:ABC-2 type transport system permease protein